MPRSGGPGSVTDEQVAAVVTRAARGFQEAVELFGVDAVRSFDLAVQSRRVRPDAHVADALVEQMPVEGRAEFRAIIGLDLLDVERQLGQHVVDELDRRLLSLRG